MAFAQNAKLMLSYDLGYDSVFEPILTSDLGWEAIGTMLQPIPPPRKKQSKGSTKHPMIHGSSKRHPFSLFEEPWVSKETNDALRTKIQHSLNDDVGALLFPQPKSYMLYYDDDEEEKIYASEFSVPVQVSEDIEPSSALVIGNVTLLQQEDISFVKYALSVHDEKLRQWEQKLETVAEKVGNKFGLLCSQREPTYYTWISRASMEESKTQEAEESFLSMCDAVVSSLDANSIIPYLEAKCTKDVEEINRPHIICLLNDSEGFRGVIKVLQDVKRKTQNGQKHLNLLKVHVDQLPQQNQINC